MMDHIDTPILTQATDRFNPALIPAIGQTIGGLLGIGKKKDPNLDPYRLAQYQAEVAKKKEQTKVVQYLALAVVATLAVVVLIKYR